MKDSPTSLTLLDVARKASVSTATVSRVLNGIGPLKPCTRKRVLRAVAQLRYRPKDVQFVSVASSDSPFGGQEAAREVLDSGFDPTAIVCVNDFMALGVLPELRDRGGRVPQEISVTGFDNISLAQFVSPPLTTVNIPRDKIAQLIFKALFPEDEGTELRGREVQIRPELVIRGTTGPARPAKP